MISGFTGRYRFLSNFYPSVVSWHGIMWPTVEHAYQASKATNGNDRYLIELCKSAGQAKRKGRLILLRPDWDEVKLEIMLQLLRKKFSLADLRTKLLSTGQEPLREENLWDDQFWGTVNGKGENHLGRLLMQVRSEIKSS